MHLWAVTHQLSGFPDVKPQLLGQAQGEGVPQPVRGELSIQLYFNWLLDSQPPQLLSQYLPW
jgi:hypothetical protein